MNEQILEGQWKQLKGKVKEQWGRLTNDELDQLEGRRDQIVGLLQEKYGYTIDEAEEQFDDFLDSLDDDRWS